MATTTNLGIEIPDVGADNNTWGAILNNALQSYDAIFKSDGTGTSVGLNVGAGKVLTVAGTLAATGTVTLPAGATAGGAQVVTVSGAQTLTNKTLTNPVIAAISNGGTLTLPSATDTLVGRATTDTLTNKTLASPAFTGTPTGTVTAGTYVPTVNNGASLGTGASLNYIRIGNVVFVSGYLSVTPDPPYLDDFFFNLSLPIASNFTTTNDLGGCGAGSWDGSSPTVLRIVADPTNDNAKCLCVNSEGAGVLLGISFSYVVK